MTSKTIYHYVYRITNLVEKKHYYGKRSSRIEPKLDLGIKYFSSSRDKEFQADQKSNPQNYKYKIVQIFHKVEEACLREIELHSRFKVGSNSNFYNLVTQTHNKFDTTGKFLAENLYGDKILISKSDERYISGEYISCKYGFTKKGRIFTTTHKEKLSKSAKGVNKSKEAIAKSVSTRHKLGIGEGKNHWKFKYYYRTPWGIFDSPEVLEPEFTMSRMKNFCINSNKKMYPSVYKNCIKLQETFDKSIIGKTYKEIGFWIIPKDEYDPNKTY
jgi:hypothetical protein